MSNMFLTLLSCFGIFLINALASNPEIDFPDYIIEISENVYVTITDVESIQSSTYATSYSTNTVSSVMTIYHDITQYHTKTKTHIKKIDVYVTELYTSCITETQNTYMSHISTETVTSNIINTSVINSAIFSTISDQVTTTSYQSIPIVEILTEIDTTTITVPLKFCNATIIPKNLEELTSVFVEFHKQQEQNMNYFLNGADQPMIKAINVNLQETTPAIVPFDWNLLLSISTNLTLFDITKFKYTTIYNLYYYQQIILQALQEGESMNLIVSLYMSWTDNVLDSFDLFFSRFIPADYPKNYDTLKSLYIMWLKQQFTEYYNGVYNSSWADSIIQYMSFDFNLYTAMLNQTPFIVG